jgi:HEAT repeat protein
VAHVFISYVRENLDVVDQLAKKLRNSGVTVWLDRDDIEPGARWRDAIKQAIRSGKFFLACFSTEFKDRDRTHMNEELTLAIDEIRIRPTERTWFIPVLLNKTEIPTRRISNTEDLSDINAIKLYENLDDGVQRILRVSMCDDPVFARMFYLMDIVDRPFDGERLHAIQQLAAIGGAAKPSVSILIKATKENNTEIKKAFLRALARIAPSAPEVMLPLAAALKDDPHQDVRGTAAAAFGMVGPRAVEAVPALATALKDDLHEGVRRRAAKALGMIGPLAAEAVSALAAGLEDPDQGVRENAVEALGMIGPLAAEAASALAAILRGDLKYLRLRVQAAFALGEIGPAAAEAVPALAACAYKDPDEAVEGYAARALEKILGKARGSEELRAVLIGHRLRQLTADLKDPDEHVRWYAATELGSIGVPAAEAVPALVAIRKDDPDKGVRESAANALRRIGPTAPRGRPNPRHRPQKPR